jgi:hypothetical protein
MNVLRYWIASALTVGTVVAFTNPAAASPASTIGKALSRYAEETLANKGAQTITKEVGEATVERVAARIVKDSGEAGVERVSALVAKCGPDVVRAIDNTPNVVPLLKALDEVPAEQLPKAVARLAAGQQGKELAETTVRYGAKALRSEVAHPGVGGRLVRAFGDDGASLCGKLSTDEAIALGRHMDGLASVPVSQRKGLFELIAKDKDRFFTWLGKFVEENPGKTIGSVTFLCAFLPNAERIIGGDPIVFDKDGNPQVMHKPGLVGQVASVAAKPVGEGLTWITRGIAIVVIGAIALFAFIKLFGVWRRERIRITEAARHL